MTFPFDYPAAQHVRRHSPRGYADYSSFRPWLRDEFSFRCVYCLLREQWARHGSFGADHFLAVAHHPQKATDYDNLLYACVTCNAVKSDRLLPNPVRVLLRNSVQVAADGHIHTDDAAAAHLIELLGLDSDHSNEFRMLWIGIIALAAKHDPALHRRLMGFPADLPNLARLRPPGGNKRPLGIEESHHAKKLRGTLPDFY
ncbi:MAG: hypothetical protein L0Y72_12475 [Gemmataceae bacterium]|nr:hypothetical protein [Gemmataceae bacterium]MCI0739853.1 hypothetical protein [Gemmataceae bacterium]